MINLTFTKSAPQPKFKTSSSFVPSLTISASRQHLKIYKEVRIIRTQIDCIALKFSH